MIGPRIDRAAVRLREDPTTFLPQLRSALTFFGLGIPVLAQRPDQRTGDAHCSLSGARFYVYLD